MAPNAFVCGTRWTDDIRETLWLHGTQTITCLLYRNPPSVCVTPKTEEVCTERHRSSPFLPPNASGDGFVGARNDSQLKIPQTHNITLPKAPFSDFRVIDDYPVATVEVLDSPFAVFADNAAVFSGEGGFVECHIAGPRPSKDCTAGWHGNPSRRVFAREDFQRHVFRHSISTFRRAENKPVRRCPFPHAVVATHTSAGIIRFRPVKSSRPQVGNGGLPVHGIVQESPGLSPEPPDIIAGRP